MPLIASNTAAWTSAAFRVASSGLVGGLLRRAASNRFRFQSVTSSARAVVGMSVKTAKTSKSFVTFILISLIGELRAPHRLARYTFLFLRANVPSSADYHRRGLERNRELCLSSQTVSPSFSVFWINPTANARIK